MLLRADRMSPLGRMHPHPHPHPRPLSVISLVALPCPALPLLGVVQERWGRHCEERGRALDRKNNVTRLYAKVSYPPQPPQPVSRYGRKGRGWPLEWGFLL
jgi:hypothetical protein